MIPILAPAGVQELIDNGLYGYALSRYSGCWVGIKCLKDTVKSTASVDAALDRVRPVVPTDFMLATGRAQHPPRAIRRCWSQEKRLQNYKRDAVSAWLRANRLDSLIISGGGRARLGTVAAGKYYLGPPGIDELGMTNCAPMRWACGFIRSPAPGRLNRKGCVNSRKVSTRSSSSRKSAP